MTPTARSLQHFRKHGLTAQVVERFNTFSKKRVDLFGFIDLVVLSPLGICGVQVTSGSHVSHRYEKIRAEPKAVQWMRAGGSIVVHGWRKAGPRGKRKIWSLRVVKAVLSEGVISFEESENAE